MGQTLTEKILDDHLVEGELETGEEIGIEIDQVLTQDTTGTMVWLQFEAMGLDEVQTEIAAQYCDHQTYQFDFKNTDDHRFLRSAAGKYGAHFSRPATVSATTSTARTSQRPARRCSVPTATPRRPVESANSPSAPAGSTSPSPWAAHRTTSRCPRSSAFASRRASRVGHCKGRHLGAAPPTERQGGVGKILEYTGPGVETPDRTRADDHHQHGNGTRRDDVDLPPTDHQTEDYLERVGRGEEYVELQPTTTPTTTTRSSSTSPTSSR